MKTTLLLISMFLALHSFCQEEAHPYKDLQLLIGNGYFKPIDDSGDGTYRFAQLRALPISSQNGRAAFGLFANVIQVSSMMDRYIYGSEQYGLGLAANFILPENVKQKFAWLDLAYGWKNSRGRIRQGTSVYTDQQKDQMFIFSGGLIFRSSVIDAYEAPFLQQKIMLEASIPMKSVKQATWEDQPLDSDPWNNKRYKLYLDNGIIPIFLGWSRNYYLMPNIQASYIYESGVPRSLFGFGAGITLSKGQYGYEILSLSYHPLFTKGEVRRDVFEATLNLVSLFRRTL